MRRSAKILTWTAGVLGGTIVIAVAALLAVQPYLNSPGVRRNIEKDLSRRLGGTVTFRRIEATLFPLPGLTVQNVDAVIPKTVQARIASVSIYPRLAPLLRGRFLVSRIRVRGARTVVMLPQTLAETSPEELSLREVKEEIEQVLASLASAGPGLTFELEGGTMTVVSAGKRLLAVRDAGARVVLPPGTLFIDLHGSAEPWGEFLLKGGFLIDERAVRTEGLDMRLGRSRLSGLSARLDWSGREGFEVSDGKASLDLGELFSWAASSELLRPFLRDVGALQGKAEIGTVRARGPLASPRSWTWSVHGRLRNVVVGSDLLPAPLSVSGDVACSERSLSASDLSASLGRSAVSGAAFRIGWKGALRMEVLSARAMVSLDDLFLWRSRLNGLVPGSLRSLGGTVKIASLRLSGPVHRPREWRIAAEGAVSDVLLDAPWLPGPVTVSRGAFAGTAPSWSFSRVQAATRDTSLSLSGTLRGLPAGISGASVAIDGSAGRETIAWLFAKSGLPDRFLLRAPVEPSGLRIAWQPGTVSVNGKALIDGGTTAAFDVVRTPEVLDIKRLSVSDPDSSANLSARFAGEGTDLSFSGNFMQTTFHRIFENQPSGPGGMRGDLRLKVPADPRQQMEARGRIDAGDIEVPWERKPALRIDELSARAEGRLITVRKAAVRLGSSRYDLSGTLTASGNRITIDGSASADRISVAELTQALFGPRKSGAPAGKGKGPLLTVAGMLRVVTGEVDYSAYRFRNARAQAAFGPGYLSLTFTRAELCGLAVPGTLVYDKGRWQLDLKASATGGDVASLLSCLSGEKVAMSGNFDLAALLWSKDQGAGLLPQLEGRVDYSARDGKIYRYPLLARVFSVLSVTELLRGKVPDLGAGGFSYHTATLKASIEKGRLKLEQAMIDGASLTVLAEGEVDLPTRNADLVVLVAPFSSVNWVIRHIPLVGRLLGGTLISVPVKVTGDISDPKVVFLAPSAVGERIVKLLERIAELPVELISPLLPEKKKDGP